MFFIESFEYLFGYFGDFIIISNINIFYIYYCDDWVVFYVGVFQCDVLIYFNIVCIGNNIYNGDRLK